MRRLSPLPLSSIMLGTALLSATLPATLSAQEAPLPPDGPATAEAGAEPAPAAASSVPRWLEEVRAQRRALQQQRRARHEARRRAIDPVGSAQQDAREEAFMRRRQELRDKVEQDRRLFLNQDFPNQGPWAQPPAPAAAPRLFGAPGDDSATGFVTPDWDNGWYFRGW